MDAVLGATLDELARVGYAALRVGHVADLARVNKTTVYRRWPTKAALVEAAFTAAAEDAPALRESDDIRSDLLAVARRTSYAMSSPRGRSLFRVLLGGFCAPEPLALASTLRKRFGAPSRRVIERAVRRGDLRPGVDPELLLQTMNGWIIEWLLRHRTPVATEQIERLVDLLLHGALPGGSPPGRTGRPLRNRPDRAGLDGDGT